MIPVTPNPMLGVSYHAVGATFAANCYAPQKYIRRWSWEIFWMTQAAWCWLLWPIIGAILTIPHLWQVISDSPKDAMLYSWLAGVVYGIGGTAFNISIRYIGFALTYAIAVGMSSILGTLAEPIYRSLFTATGKGGLADLLHETGAGWIVAGMAVGTLGIAMCGVAGRFKEVDLRDQQSGSGEFSWTKGLAFSVLAGVLSAVYGIGIGVAAAPIVKVAEELGAGYWQGNIAYVFVNPGAFLTAFAYSFYLARRNRTLGQLTQLAPGNERASLLGNYLLAFLTGTLWYGQFFFYNLGHVRLGNYKFTSWAIHMIMLVLISNVTGVLFKEWKGCRSRTRIAISVALVVLVMAVVMLARGNYLGDLSKKSQESVPAADVAT